MADAAKVMADKLWHSMPDFETATLDRRTFDYGVKLARMEMLDDIADAYDAGAQKILDRMADISYDMVNYEPRLDNPHRTSSP